MTTSLDVIHAVGAMLAVDGPNGFNPERVTYGEAVKMHEARRVTRPLAARAWATHDAARSMYNLEGWRGGIIHSLVTVFDGDLDPEECREAYDEVLRNVPDAFCRHCRRPVVEVDGVLIDDCARDRAACLRALDYTHKRASAADLPLLLPNETKGTKS